jgi:hypothetical protein
MDGHLGRHSCFSFWYDPHSIVVLHRIVVLLLILELKEL